MKRVIRNITAHAEGTTEQGKGKQERFYIRTGLTLLNLALSDRRSGGLLPGSVMNIVGDSSSGKTFVALGLLAEAANDNRLDEYDLIHDDPEHGNNFNVRKIFGNKAADRILPPDTDADGLPVPSETITDFQANVRKRLKAGKPFIYILDSLDSIYAEEEMEHADAVEKAREKGTAAKGSYGMQKAKAMSILLRLLVGAISKTRSILIIVSQTRENIDPMSFQKKTCAGGKALEFYCNYRVWTAIKEKLVEKVGKKERRVGVGVQCRMKITKCRGTGKVREIDFPIRFDYGPDDLGSCVDFLIEEQEWPKKGGIVQATGLGLSGYRDKLIQQIEEDGVEGSVRAQVRNVWARLEQELENRNRKKRYS